MSDYSFKNPKTGKIIRILILRYIGCTTVFPLFTFVYSYALTTSNELGDKLYLDIWR